MKNNGHVSVVYEDEDLIIFDKFQGIPSAGGKNESFCDLVFREYPALSGVSGYKHSDGGLLNRLDNETGGLLLFAKTDEAFKNYNIIMKNGFFHKTYYAVVDGIPPAKKGFINKEIAHHKTKKKKMTIAQNDNYRSKPRPAYTEFEIVESKNDKSLLRLVINNGVRHQIRVHLSAIGCPIVNDSLYNRNNKGSAFHMLYATGLKWTNLSGMIKKVEIHCPFSL